MACPILICSAQGVGNSAATACQGELTFIFSGISGGGNAQLQVSPDDGATWVNYGAALTADGVLQGYIPLGAQVRVVVAVAGSVTVCAGLWDNH